jgi:ATP-dependent Clp protease ATP-binding subunit ClpA
MFERFTDRSRRVVVLAQEEARMLNREHVGTEHILLGLVREDGGVAAQARPARPGDISRLRRGARRY